MVAVYQVATNKVGFTRQAGFALIQQEQMVLSYVRQHGQIKRSEVMELCRLSSAMGFYELLWVQGLETKQKKTIYGSLRAPFACLLSDFILSPFQEALCHPASSTPASTAPHLSLA